MSRILAISDIHGCYDEFIELLDTVRYDHSKDILVLMGDYCDRGLKSKQVIDKCIELKDKGAITLKGNHCDIFLNWLLTDGYNHKAMFLNNGGIATIESYLGVNWINNGLTHENYQYAKNFILDHYKHHIDFLKSNKHYHQIDQHVFVHAGVKPDLEDWKDSTLQEMLWIREEFLENDHNYNEIFVHGHTPNKLIHGSHDVYFGNKKIGIDGGVCFKGGQLNCLEIIDGKYKQYNI